MSDKKIVNHIIVPNDVFGDYSKNKARNLTIDELYLHSWLHRDRIPDEWITKTSIDFISHECQKFSKGNDSRNKQNIKDMLITLKEKKYISTIGQFDINEKMKNSDSLLIQFSFIDTKIGYNGKITYKIFDQFEDPLEFFIYAYIDCYGDTGRTISNHKWSKIAKRSETTMKETVEKMNTYTVKPRVWKFSGDYYTTEQGEARQQENTYYTRPDEDTIKKWNGFYAREGIDKDWELAFGYRGNGGNKNSDNEWGHNDPF